MPGVSTFDRRRHDARMRRSYVNGASAIRRAGRCRCSNGARRRHGRKPAYNSDLRLRCFVELAAALEDRAKRAHNRLAKSRMLPGRRGVARVAAMTFEMMALVLAIGLGLLHIILASHAASLQRGYRWTASARDEVVPPLAGVAGRLSRAQSNFLETFPIFAALALAIHVVHAHDWRTIWGVSLYVAGRVIYLPLYALGVPLVRSLVWNVAFAGIALLMWAVLKPQL
jgi:uncharacterized MAPEG superfamily protein